MGADPKLGQRCVGGRAARPCQHLFDHPASGYEKTDGASDLLGELAGRARQLWGNNDRCGYASPIQSLQRREMTWFEAADLSVNGGDMLLLCH